MATRYPLYSVLALALAISIWIGLRRIAWDAAYQTVGLVIPAQELSSSLSDDELRDSLARMRAQGVVALSVELSNLPDWGLERTDFSDTVARVLHAAQAVGLGIAFVVDSDQQEMPSFTLRPDVVIPISEHGSVVPSWMITDFRDAMLGILEFSEPSGLRALYEWGWRNFVRVHAIKSRELDRLELEGALARWERAVQERTIRLLWVTEHHRFPQYLERLSRRLTRLGMELGQPSAPTPFENSYLVYLAIGAGFVSLIVLVLMNFSQLPVIVLLLVGVIGVGALALLGGWDFERARQALALMIAVLAPWLLLFVAREKVSGWKLLVAVSLSASGAGLGIAALLSDLSYFLKITEFRGVKLALIAPSALIVLTELWRWRERGWSKLTAQLRRGAWLVPAVGLGALVLVLERSGNLPAIPVARWEELIRERLEDWLTARPRFKEFFVGHPALVLWRREQTLSQLGLLALGALGQASIINTFVHLHTPLALSLWRTLNGLVLGLFIGLVLRGALGGVTRWRRHS
ncbi:MAG: DUF5693 family protein [Candidatus Bipolaricaulota bacterium]|nr:DUF5693 family protein [Candidatus Bipolaricaulota bacterium]